jgi:hypothetical protein
MNVIWRFFDLAVARGLQSMRAVDVKSMRSFLGADRRCYAKLGGRFSKYKTDGAVVGEVAGRDERGFEYKRWHVINPEAAKQTLAYHKIKPLRPEAYQGWTLPEDGEAA